jgi:hypothetical protein
VRACACVRADGLTFGEFLELLACAACEKLRNPFFSVCARLDSVIVASLAPLAERRSDLS